LSRWTKDAGRDRSREEGEEEEEEEEGEAVAVCVCVEGERGGCYVLLCARGEIRKGLPVEGRRPRQTTRTAATTRTVAGRQRRGGKIMGHQQRGGDGGRVAVSCVVWGGSVD